MHQPKQAFLIAFLLFLFTAVTEIRGWSQTTVFADDFSTQTSTAYITSGVINGSNWSVTRSGDDWGARRNTSPAQLELTNDATNTDNAIGWVLASVNTNVFASPYNAKLSANPGLVTWTFNMRQPRSDPSGFTSGAYGVAFMLAGNSTNPREAGNGYAVVLGNNGTTDSVRLIRFEGGLQDATHITNLIGAKTAGLTVSPTNYLSIKVTYNPYSDTWELFVRKDGTSSFADPASNGLESQGTVVNNSYTASTLSYLGAYWQGGTSAGQTAYFDNVKVSVTAVPAMNVISNGTAIANGSAIPSVANNTDFGSVVVSTGSVTQLFSIQNPGSATLNLTSASPYIAISGANASDFSITAAPSGTIASSGSTSFQIRFTPSALGTRNATVSIANNTSDKNPYTFAIQGTGVLYVTAATDYFRSRQTGIWNATSTWESSTDSINWHPSTIIPTSSAKGIIIQTGFPVTVSSSNRTMNNVTLNDSLIFYGETTKLTLPANGVMNINNGGVLKFSQTTADYPTLVSLGTGSVITINSGGMISVSSNSGTDMNIFATDATGTFVWKNNSVFEWNYRTAFKTAGLTYFPNANAVTVPVFRISKSGVVGATQTKIYGLVENNTDLTWQNGGAINFRNGIIGTGILRFSEGGTVTIGDFSGATSTTAQIGGSGAITKGTGTLSIAISNLCNATLSSSKSISSASVIVNPTATLNAGNYQLTGTASTLTVSGTFKTAHPDGFSGNTTGSVPQSSFGSVVINAGSTVDYTSASAQTLTANNYGNLTFSGAGTKSLAGNAAVGGDLTLASGTLAIGANTLTLNGGVTHTNSGSLSGGTDPASATANLTLNGSAAKRLYFAIGKYYLHNVLINNTATNVILDDSLYITGGASFGTLMVNGALNTNNYLSIKSSEGGDGVVGQSSNTSNSTITGDVTVERYIPKRRAWRFMSVPTVSSTQTINAAWQEGSLPNADVITHNNPKPGYGTEITYDNMPSHGFDVNTTVNASLKYASSSSTSWLPVASTFSPINDYEHTHQYAAYYLFVRGSRTVDLSKGTSAIADNTILRTTGTLNTGSFSHNYVTTQGISVLVSNPFASPIDILHVLGNGNNPANFNPVKFWVWDPATAGRYGVGAYITYTNGLQVPASSAYNGGTYAQSGQAFLLEPKFTGNTVVSFAETDKVSGGQTNVFGRVASEPSKKYPAVYANLLMQEGDSLSLLDGVAAGFDNRFSASVDDDDADKLMNTGDNIALLREGRRLAIEFRPVPVSTDTLFVKLYLKQQPYKLQIFSQNLRENLPAEGWLVDKYLNTQTAVNLYDTTLYSFTPNTDTNSYRNRFMLVFNRVRNTAFTALTGEANTKALTAETGKSGIGIYPNPVTEGTVNLRLSSLPQGKYAIGIFNANGRAVYQHAVTVSQSGAVQRFSLAIGKQLPAGSYTLQVANNSGNTVYSDRIIVVE